MNNIIKSNEINEITTAINEGKDEQALRIINNEVDGLILQGSSEVFSALFNCASNVISNVSTAYYTNVEKVFTNAIEKEVQRQAQELASEDRAFEVLMNVYIHAIDNLEKCGDEKSYEMMKNMIDNANKNFEEKIKKSTKPSILSVLSDWLHRKSKR